jgi:tetratricopeptide (TPR) repeat protein
VRRIGDLLGGVLDDPTQALEAYKSVLAGGFDEEAARAIRKLGEERDELRADAADALEPVLRAATRWPDVADVLEMRLRAQTEAVERANTLHAIAKVAERELDDRARAMDALLRALAEEPASERIHGDLERLAAMLGAEGWSRYADALADRAGAIFEATVTTRLLVRLGMIAEAELKDDVRAARAYAQAAEQAGDTPETLGALDRLYARIGDTRALADVLERRIALETTAKGQADFYHRLASLQISEFGEKGQGLGTLRTALERVPDHAPSRDAMVQLLEDDQLFDDAFDALEFVYKSLGQAAERAELYEKRVTRAPSKRDRIRARLDLAKVLEEAVRDLGRAQEVIEAAIAEDPSDADALAELERLAGASHGWASAAEALTRALHDAERLSTRAVAEARDLTSGSVSELWVRLAGWRRDKLEDATGAEEAFLNALKVDRENLDIIRAVESLRRAPGRERDLVDILQRRAKLETDLGRKRELYQEAKTLAQASVGDAALAESVLRDLLAEDEADAWALDELTLLREAAGDHEEVVKLLGRRADQAADGVAALALKHAAATVILERIQDADRAVAAYEEIWDAEPNDEVAAAQLRRLYAETANHRKLAKLLETLIERARGPDERSKLRLDLAQLQVEQFESPKDASETLRAILEEDPMHAEAVVRLSRILEESGQDEELAELLSTQMQRAGERGDLAGERALSVRLAEVYEGRLQDVTRALATYEAVLAKDPAHRGALEAVARLSEGRNAWERAAGALSSLLEVEGGESVEVAVRLARAKEKLGDTSGIETALKRALAIDATNSDVRGQLRTLYEKEKKWQELADLLVGDAKLISIAHPSVRPPEARNNSSVPPVPSVPPRGMGAAPPAVPAAIVDQVKLLRRAAEIHLNERKSPVDAVPLLEQASALVPNDRELLLLLCDAYTAAHRERDAAHVLEKVIASFGGRRTKELSLYHHRLGKALAQLGDKDIALAQLDMAFKIDPGSISVLKDLGVLALEANDLERAQKTFKALLLQRLDPQSGISKGEVFYYLGEISAKLGDKAKAVQMLERAIENEPSLARAKAKLSELKG